MDYLNGYEPRTYRNALAGRQIGLTIPWTATLPQIIFSGTEKQTPMRLGACKNADGRVLSASALCGTAYNEKTI